MKKLLVLIDFSKGSEKAFDFACHYAMGATLEVDVMHSFKVPILDSNMSPEMLQEERKAIEKREYARIGEFVQNYGASKKSEDLANLNFDLIVQEGNIVELVEQTTLSREFELLVMGHKGLTEDSEALMGSKAFNTIRKANCPVLIIPDKAQYKIPEHILYALDLDDFSSADLDKLKQIQENSGAKVTMLHVNTGGHYMDATKMDGYRNALDATMDFENLKVEILEEDDIVTGLEEYANDNGVDLLAVQSKRYDAIPDNFLKGLTSAMIKGGQRPLLVFHADSE